MTSSDPFEDSLREMFGGFYIPSTDLTKKLLVKNVESLGIRKARISIGNQEIINKSKEYFIERIWGYFNSLGRSLLKQTISISDQNLACLFKRLNISNSDNEAVELKNNLIKELINWLENEEVFEAPWGSIRINKDTKQIELTTMPIKANLTR